MHSQEGNGPGQVYVLVVSEHNVGQLEALCHLRPDIVLAVTSDKSLAAANRFSGVVHQHGLTVELLTGLRGDNYTDTRAWAQAKLQPRLAELTARGYRSVFNYTGGTKSCCLALRDAFEWDEHHYVPFGYPPSLFVEKHPGTQSQRVPLNLDVDPLNWISLYGECEMHGPLLNPLAKHPDSLALACRLFSDIESASPVYIAVAKKLDQWSHSVQNYKSGYTIPLELSECDYLAPFVAIAEPGTVEMSGAGLTIQGKRENKWFKWFAGFWFEQVCEKWARDITPSENCVRSNITFKLGNNDTGRETDLAVYRNGQLFLVQAKVTMPSGGELQKTIDAFDNVAKTMGKATAIFATTSSLRLGHKADKIEAFTRRCKALNIQVVYTHDQFVTALSSVH